jgi:TRAP-type uncharacterized transport system substrate-binding protein
MCRLPALFVVLLLLAPPLTVAQVPSAADARARAARPSVKIITGGIEYVENTYLVLAGELAAVLDKRPDLRVLPIMGYGAVQNLEDILFLQGIDVGMLHSDIPIYMKLTKQYPGLERRLSFIVRLYDEPFHVLARREITTVQQLAGQKVVVAAPDTGGELSARTLMMLLDVEPDYVHAEWKAGVDMLRSGGAVAMIYPTRKVSSFLRGLVGVERLHFLPLTGTPATQKTYEATELTAEEYPNLIGTGRTVRTLQLATGLVNFNWSPNHERYKHLARFTTALFESLDELAKPPRHEVWRQINVDAPLLGWSRFAPAQEWVSQTAERRLRARLLARLGGSRELLSQFDEFAKFMRKEKEGRRASDDELLHDFNEFLSWKGTRTRQR